MKNITSKIRKLSTKEIKKRFEYLSLKGVSKTMEEAQEFLALRSELSFRIHFKQS